MKTLKKIIFSLILISIFVIGVGGGIKGVLIDKVYGSPNSIWKTIKSRISQITPFTPAAIVPPPPPPKAAGAQPQETTENKFFQAEIPQKEVNDSNEEKTKDENKNLPDSHQLIPAELQKTLNDAAQQIDTLAQKVNELTAAKEQKEKEIKKEKEKEKNEELKEEKKAKEEKKEQEGKEKGTCLANSVNINTALATELEKITAVGPVLAQRIIEARPFYSLNDLLKVKGIAEKTLQKIIAQGCAYVDESYSQLSGLSAAPAGGGAGGGGDSGVNGVPAGSSEQGKEKSFEGCKEGQININTATKEKLMEVKLVGKIKAQAIIDRREEKLFRSLDEITEIKGIGSNILQNFKNANYCAANPEEEKSKQEEKQETLTPKNLLLNEFFEEWSTNTLGFLPNNWSWSGTATRINQSAEGFIGNSSVELILITSNYEGFYQYGKTMDANTTYYAEVWVKGTGILKLGIKYPNSTYVYYSDERVINSEEWVSITVSRQLTESGDNGGIRLNVKYDKGQGVSSGSKFLIGAAWLSNAPPPANWPHDLP